MRRKARETALQTLYLMDVGKMALEKAFLGVSKGQDLDPKTTQFARWLVEGTWEKKEELDERIKIISQNWEMARMAALDRNLIRMGAFELLSAEDTPVSVIIDEAVEIAKIYSTEDSGKFVNGILDKLKMEKKDPPANAKPKKSSKRD